MKTQTLLQQPENRNDCCITKTPVVYANPISGRKIQDITGYTGYIRNLYNSLKHQIFI